MLDPDDQEQLLALLAWWKGAGVDVALDDTPTDWTARTSEPPGFGFQWPDAVQDTEPAATSTPTPQTPRAPPAPSQTTVQGTNRPSLLPATRQSLPSQAAPLRVFPITKPDAASLSAREAARNAQSLDALKATLQAFDGCALKVTAKNLCFYRGSPKARVMIVGEAPGREEDLEGKPFVGRSGQLLDKMLAAIGLTETDVHITNTVYWRPPGNRTPTPQETLICRPFLERQIELVAPEIIITLGGPAVKALLDVDEGILRVRGKWRDLAIGQGAGKRNVRVMPTLHPAYLLRTPAAKRQAWRDLLAIKAALAAPPGELTR